VRWCYYILPTVPSPFRAIASRCRVRNTNDLGSSSWVQGPTRTGRQDERERILEVHIPFLSVVQLALRGVDHEEAMQGYLPYTASR